MLTALLAVGAALVAGYLGTLFGARQSKVERELTKAQKRALKLSSPDLARWSEVSLSTTMQSFSGWMRTGDLTLLEEARISSGALQALLEEIHSREKTAQP